MQSYRSITKVFLAISALLLAVAITPFCFAQTPAPTPQTYMVSVVKVKPGMMDQYRELMKNETLPAFKKAGGKEWQTWTVQTLGEAGEVWTFRPVGSLKELDEPNFLTKALGEAGARAWFAKRAQLVVSSRIFLATTVPAMSVQAKAEPKLCIGVINTITPGRMPEFMKWLKENALVANAKTNSKGVATLVQGLGGNPNTVHTAVFFDNFDEMEKFVQAYGKAIADLKLQANAAVGVVSNVEFAVYRFIPELSIMPAPASASSK